MREMTPESIPLRRLPGRGCRLDPVTGVYDAAVAGIGDVEGGGIIMAGGRVGVGGALLAGEGESTIHILQRSVVDI